jgi:hypothetical protein
MILVCIAAVAMPCRMAAASQEGGAQNPPEQLKNQRSDESEVTETFIDENGPVVSADKRPITGALTQGIGSWGPRHSFMVPGLSVAQTLYDNYQFSSPGTYRGFASAAAQLQAIQYLGRGGELRYVGAVRFDSGLADAQPITNVHGVSLSETVPLGGWNLLFVDQAIYSDGALFGSSGMEGLGSIVTQLSQWSGAFGIRLGSAGLQSGLTPEQSILTLQSGRISDIAVAEVDRQLGKRSTATAVGYYGLLHFFSSGLIDETNGGFLAGYDREISARDRIGVVSGYSRLSFSGTPPVLTENHAGLLYGRQITGRLATRLGAGPLYVSSNGASADYADLDWQGQATFNLHLRSIDVQAGAMRMLTAGSGVLYGALTNTFEGGVSRTMRTGNAAFSFGVAQNQGILTGERYNTEFLGATLTHKLGRWVGAFLSYNLLHQTGANCGATSCAVTGLQQVLGVGVSWTRHPIGLP